MRRSVGALNLAQGAVYVGMAAELGPRWLPAGVLLGVAALAQAVGGIALLAGKGPRAATVAAAISLAVMGLVAGLHLQVAVHIVRTFAAEGGVQGQALLGLVLLALPWGVVLPIAQLLSARQGSPRAIAGAAAVALVAIALPPAQTWRSTSTTRHWAPVDGAAAAAWAWRRATDADPGPAPTGEGPVLLVASVVRAGAVESSQTLEGATLSEALQALTLRTSGEGNAGLQLDVGRSQGALDRPRLAPRGTALVRPAQVGLRGRDRVLSPVEVWRPPAVRNAGPGGAVTLPGLELSRFDPHGVTGWVAMDSWLATSAGVVALAHTWSAPPALSPDALRDAAVAGARHLVANMEGQRFAYVVRAPQGRPGPGYNYPRHAGGAWFLARVAQRTEDPQVRDGARQSLEFLIASSERLPDGRAYVTDPGRRDGRAWVGTTALALLAATALGERPDMQRAWALHVASAVDARGRVRGDLIRETGEWPVQPEITYAQGQGLLALAAAERAGIEGVSDALDRAVAYTDGAYWPMPAARFGMLDEHWMCLAAVAVHDVRGRAGGGQVCDAFVQGELRVVPHRRLGLQPPAGYGGGMAEAFVARAELARRRGEGGPHLERAKRWGEMLLANAYQETDAPFLVRPRALVGGFRDRPWDLDVRVDAVQHIGSALLGLEQLLRGEVLPGAMP